MPLVGSTFSCSLTFTFKRFSSDPQRLHRGEVCEEPFQVFAYALQRSACGSSFVQIKTGVSDNKRERQRALAGRAEHLRPPFAPDAKHMKRGKDPRNDVTQLETGLETDWEGLEANQTQLGPCSLVFDWVQSVTAALESLKAAQSPDKFTQREAICK